MSEERLISWLDRGILVVLVVILASSAWKLCAGSVKSRLRLKLPAAFPVPVGKPHPQRMKVSPRPGIVSPEIARAGARYMREGSDRFISGNYLAAHQAYLKAQALLPHEPAPLKAVTKMVSKLRTENAWAGIRQKARRGDLPRAWSDFSAAAGDDPTFFVDYTPAFVKILEQKAEIASAVCLLRTYCQLRPQAFPEIRKLESLRKLFAE